MPDKGHKMTDDMIAELEQKLHNLYAKADSDLQKKAASRLKKYNETVKVKEKTLDKDAFETWKKNQAYMLSNQKNLIDTITEDLVKTDQIALDIINDYTPSAYALNYNYGTYQIEDAGKINTSFALYNHDTVELLALYDDSSLLPEPKNLDIPKDLQWNKKHLSQAIAQGVLQGESIDKIAKRLSVAVGMDENGAIRNARTMMTAAQNGGRVDAYLRGKAMGIELQQKWKATEDSRTRKSHRAIDGEVIEVGEEFSNHCHFPGDPAGPGREVYNCRCTLIPLVNGIKDFNPLSDDKYIKKDFENWLKDQADPYIVSKFGDKSLNKVYHQLLDEKGSKIGNYFYNHVLGDIGKSSQTWKDYINGTLDTANTKKIDDYLFKHFDLNANKLDDVATKNVNNVINGKDISATWTRRSDQFDFEIDDVIDAQGFDGLPRVVDAEEFDRCVQESNFVAQRAYSAPDQDTLNAYKEQLYNGKWYVDCSTGGATYGSGMYAVPNYNGIIDKQMSDSMIQYQNRWGARPSTVETFTLTKDAKIITTSELQKMKSEFQAKAMEELNKTNWSKETMAKWDFISRNDDGVLATKLGYDAIKVDVKSSGDYQEIVILNRTKCIFKGE